MVTATGGWYNRCSLTRLGEVGHGPAWHGEVWQGEARQGRREKSRLLLCATISDMTTRVETEAGLLRAGAILTRSGPITYSRAELGMSGPANEPVTIERTQATLSHPDTLASLRGAPVTLGHPLEGVTPSNFKDVVVGAVAGEPRVQGDIITGDLLVGDKDALKRLDEGIDELSIGYAFVLGNDLRTRGGLQVNHVAIVERGRAGSSVRVLDSLEGDDMEKQDIIDAVVAGMDAGMHKWKAGDAADAGYEKAMRDALAPVMDEMKKMKDAQDAALTAADAAKSDAEAKAAGDKLADAVRAEERERYSVLTDALPLIAEDKRAALADADPKAILVAALGDSVPEADSKSVDFLRGALAIAKTKAAADAAGLPTGVRAFDSSLNVTNAQDARAKAQAEYEAAINKRYTDAGGI